MCPHITQSVRSALTFLKKDTHIFLEIPFSLFHLILTMAQRPNFKMASYLDTGLQNMNFKDTELVHATHGERVWKTLNLKCKENVK